MPAVRSTLRVTITAAVSALALGSMASSASAMHDVAMHDVAMRHLKLVRSSPAADSVMATSPDAIRLWLSEPAEAPVSKIALATDAGTAIAVGAVTRDAAKDAPLVAKITKPLSAGGYKVT